MAQTPLLKGAESTSSVVVTVVPVNDAPVITSDAQTGALTEDHTNTIAIGMVVATDVDMGDSLTYGVDDSQGTYGSISLDTQTGQWIYTIDNTLPVFETLVNNTTDTDTFTLTVTDILGATTQQNIVMTISGAYDVISVFTLQNVKVVDTALISDTVLTDFGLDVENEKLIQFDIYIDDSATNIISNVTGVEFDINNINSVLKAYSSTLLEYDLFSVESGSYFATGYDVIDANNVQVAKFYGAQSILDDGSLLPLNLTLSNIVISMGQDSVGVDDIDLFVTHDIV